MVSGQNTTSLNRATQSPNHTFEKLKLSFTSRQLHCISIHMMGGRKVRRKNGPVDCKENWQSAWCVKRINAGFTLIKVHKKNQCVPLYGHRPVLRRPTHHTSFSTLNIWGNSVIAAHVSFCWQYYRKKKRQKIKFKMKIFFWKNHFLRTSDKIGKNLKANCVDHWSTFL